MQCRQSSRGQSRSRQFRQYGSHLWNSCERYRQGEHVAWICRLERDAAQQTFQVENSIQRPPQFFSSYRIFDLDLDRIEPGLDLGSIQTRTEHPGTQQALAHRRYRGIEAAEQCYSWVCSCEEGFDQLQVSHRHGIEDQA